MLEHSKFTLNVAVFIRHEHFLHPKSGSLQEVSKESVHIYVKRVSKEPIPKLIDFSHLIPINFNYC